ncbi:MAG: bifunctional hydroxymethylpyrimidine kinase/phosphomethylpyrimidine kinase, partial [Alphaproteobacteria bacterium]|nr:bifunctional hydroxymethylpyrimidine kinase/phosphomethylpyrimidine kinase [Alphaproteobacteria bacterium]
MTSATTAASPLRVLVIAGSDSSAGAGIQADIKTAEAFGCYAQTAVTAVTVQDTRRVYEVFALSPKLVADQIEACLGDIGADAIKIGMLGSAATIKAVAAVLSGVRIPIVLDPVMASTSGRAFLDDKAVAALKAELIPLAALVTPNIPEALRLTGKRGTEVAARALMAMGARAALIKGGHATGATVDDVLVWEGGVDTYAFPRLKTKHTHGTGCTLSTAIACGLAQGLPLPVAVGRAREYLQHALETAPGLGKGHGPLDHL